jgi:hypothetical protein
MNRHIGQRMHYGFPYLANILLDPSRSRGIYRTVSLRCGHRSPVRIDRGCLAVRSTQIKANDDRCLLIHGMHIEKYILIIKRFLLDTISRLREEPARPIHARARQRQPGQYSPDRGNPG